MQHYRYEHCVESFTDTSKGKLQYHGCFLMVGIFSIARRAKRSCNYIKCRQTWHEKRERICSEGPCHTKIRTTTLTMDEIGGVVEGVDEPWVLLWGLGSGAERRGRLLSGELVARQCLRRKLKIKSPSRNWPNHLLLVAFQKSIHLMNHPAWRKKNTQFHLLQHRTYDAAQTCIKGYRRGQKKINWLIYPSSQLKKTAVAMNLLYTTPNKTFWCHKPHN